MSSIIKLLSGRDLTPNQYNSNAIGIPYMTGASNFLNGELIINRWTPSPITISQKGDLLITCKGTIGEMAYNNVGKIHIARQIMAISTDYIELAYVKIFLSTLITELNAKAKSMIPGISRENILDTFIPLPPLNEQKRIAQRIEEIQPLIDKYRVVQEQAEEMDKSLNGLLKKSILQYAIQGKLVPQIESEEPASILLEKIQQEKLKLVKEGKLKKKDLDNSVIFKGDDNKYFEKKGNEVVCIDDEIPFEIPDSWEWVRMGDVGNWGAGSTPNRANHEYYNNGEILWLKTGELNDDIVYDTIEKITQKAFNECSLRLNRVGDVLIAMYGATIGKIAIVGKELTTNQACCGCSPYSGLYNRYLFYYLMANKSTFIKQGEGGAQPNISRDKLVKFLMPLPPLQEQKRIVKALDNVLASIMRN